MKNSILPTAKLLIILSALCFGMSSCDKDEKPPQSVTPIPIISDTTQGFFVTNEGGFMKNEASLSFINLDSNQLFPDVYASTNSEPLGDIAQSVTKINDDLYVVVNNSAKIVVINPLTFVKKGEITGLGSPNNIISGSVNHAYVTDLFGGPISVVNLSTKTVVKSIPCPGSTGEMLNLNGKTYVTNSSSSYLYVINHTTDAISDSILVGQGAATIQDDLAGNLWIGFGQLYDANYNVIEQGKLKKVSPLSKTVTLNLPLVSGGIRKLRMNKEKNILYFINKDLFKMSVAASSLPVGPFYSNSPSSFYGLGVDLNSNSVYVTDPKDFSSTGTVFQVNSAGVLTNTFFTGIIPGEFYFMNK